MEESETNTEKKPSAEWFFRGLLVKLGDTFDRFTGRRWTPSSSLAASELITKLTSLLDDESIEVAGKGTVVPHNIKLKIQWDKFSTDSDGILKTLETELLTAAIDHINDKLYYTYAPVTLEVKPDYFVSGVKLLAGFEKFADEKESAELNVTIPNIRSGLNISGEIASPAKSVHVLVARFELIGAHKTSKIPIPASGRISIGRASQNDLMLEDPSISKIHASISMKANLQLMVADTGSTNGTFVNGSRIPYGQPVLLDHDGKVSFGNVVVTFEVQTKTPDTSAGPDIDRTEIVNLSLQGSPADIRIEKTLDMVEENKDSTVK